MVWERPSSVAVRSVGVAVFVALVGSSAGELNAQTPEWVVHRLPDDTIVPTIKYVRGLSSYSVEARISRLVQTTVESRVAEDLVYPGERTRPKRIRGPNGWLVLAVLGVSSALVGAFEAKLLEAVLDAPGKYSVLKHAAIWGAGGAGLGLVYCVAVQCEWSSPLRARVSPYPGSGSALKVGVPILTWTFAK